MTRPDSGSAGRMQPLTPLSLAVLLSLAEGEQHGYALLKSIERESEGGLKPGTGTLYAALGRMIEEGVIEEVAGRAGEDARRRYYGLTEEGREVLRAELRRLARVVESGASRDLLPELRVVWRSRSR